MSLQVGEMPNLNPGLQVSQSGALPLSHDIPVFAHLAYPWAGWTRCQLLRPPAAGGRARAE